MPSKSMVPRFGLLYKMKYGTGEVVVDQEVPEFVDSVKLFGLTAAELPSKFNVEATDCADRMK